jgi:hypothetical protein
MAIRLIKEIINNKGYVINSKDREIFQQGDLQSFFGFSDSDAIEFILYDINDNQLPQRDGELVRYVVLSTENIKDYLMIADGTVFQSNVIPEYFIDIERLIREAGYDNGIFKAQITLINKRVGTEDESNRLWIKEISPSRTEVRLLPLNKKETPEELKTRFDIFYRDGDFRDDVAPFIEQYLEKINPLTTISYINGRYSENNWLNKLKEEFKIQNFEKFISDVSVKFVEASKYEFSNRISDITNINYGKLKSTPIGLELSVKDVKEKCRAILLQCINYYLPQQNIQTTTTATIQNNASVDEIQTFIRTNSSQNQFDSNSPTVETVTQKSVGTQTGTVSIGGETTNQTNTTSSGGDGGGTTIILGACVLSNGNCSQKSKEECESIGGTYLGDGSNCPIVSTGDTSTPTGGSSGFISNGGRVDLPVADGGSAIQFEIQVT